VQCPDCGVEVERLTGGSCPRCFAGRNELAVVPRTVDIIMCASCYAVKEGKTWHDAGPRTRDEMIEQSVVASVQLHKALDDTNIVIDPTPQDENNIHFDIMVDGLVQDVRLDAMYETVARIRHGVCTACSRIAGGYYSAIIQFRATGRDPTDEEREEAGGIVIRAIDRMKAEGNVNAFISKQGKVRGGHDFYISENDVARIVAKRLADRFDADVKDAPKLVGRKEGKDVYRVNYLVRMPPYRRGDFIARGKEVHSVERVERRVIVLKGLVSGREQAVPREQITAADVIAKRRDARELLVVSVVHDEALLLDAVTNKTYEILLPPNFTYDLAIRTLLVIEHEDQAYFAGVPERYRSGLPVAG
jgi:nonsense-mediated mRNA decay protein 3